MKLIDNLIEELTQLPSIGRKSAQRLAYFILNRDLGKVKKLSEAIFEARQNIRECRQCHNYAENDLCPICENPRRQSDQICVVERPEDIVLLEKFGVYQGHYHVLGGSLSPLDGIGPDQLHFNTLLNRCRIMGEGELILALNTNPEGESTILYLLKQLQGLSLKITRLARGIPLGSDLQYVDEITMQKALEFRVNL